MLPSRVCRASVLSLVALVPLLAACSDNSAVDAASRETVAVTSTDSTCDVAKTDLAAGPVTLAVTNKGSAVTEVYVYGKDGDAFSKVIGEVEDIGPGTSRDLQTTLDAGTYEVACKPGQKGDGIRTKITVK